MICSTRKFVSTFLYHSYFECPTVYTNAEGLVTSTCFLYLTPVIQYTDRTESKRGL